MTVVEDFQADTENLAAATQRHVLTIYAAYLAGDITEPEVTPLIAAAINQATAVAVGLGDAWMVAQVEDATGVAALAAGVVPADDIDRLSKAVKTVLGDPDSAEMRLDRLARAETFDAAQNGTHAAMQQQPAVQGWTRQMDGDPCQLCRWWSRDGRVWPKRHPFQRHKGCNCQPRIVLADNIESTGYTRRLERNVRAS